MAHEYLSCRRLDRLYHRATLRFPEPSPPSTNTTTSCCSSTTIVTTAKTTTTTTRPFLVLSLTGDLFLHGQVPRVIGLLIALIRGVVEPDFVTCVFDETYPHLIPTPCAPNLGMYALEAYYTTWEGKAKSILTARKCNRYNQGWNQSCTLQRVEQWQTIVREHVARQWNTTTTTSTVMDDHNQACCCWDQDHNKNNNNNAIKRFALERQWTDQVLMPWAVQAKTYLEEYRQWKTSQTAKAAGAEVAVVAPGGVGSSAGSPCALVVNHHNNNNNNNAPNIIDDDNDEGVSSSSLLVPSSTVSSTGMKEEEEKEMLSSTATTHDAVVPPPNDVTSPFIDDASVPELYQKVLTLLQQADQSGKWPTTTPKRQLVMVSNVKTTERRKRVIIGNQTTTNNGDDKEDRVVLEETTSTSKSNTNPTNNNKDRHSPPPHHHKKASTSTRAARAAALSSVTASSSTSSSTSLAMAHIRAKANFLDKDQASPYDYVEGQGGASGSFSVGAMPGEQCRIQPKANEVFPQLMKAAFELEIALNIPNREPSSTIAINRNAQFRPYVILNVYIYVCVSMLTRLLLCFAS